MYPACIESIDWSEVLLSQSSLSSRDSLIHDCSPGRTEDTGDFRWNDPVVAVVVDEGSSKRCRAQIFRSGPSIAGEEASDDTICKFDGVVMAETWFHSGPSAVRYGPYHD